MKETVRVARPVVPTIPLVFDSPHSGSIYPADFDHVIDRMVLRRSEDAHVEELFSHVTAYGATLVHALFPRAYVDPNRKDDDIDVEMFSDEWTGPANPTYKTLQRKVGLIWRDMRAAGPIYDRKLTAAEAQSRIEGFWRPYHAALDLEIETLHSRFGAVYHVNCHSMMSMGDSTTEDGPVRRPDFVIGDREGTTCAPAMTECVVETLRGLGYSVSVNDPYKGYELVRKHGRPSEGRHSIQIEINRALYMDEATMSKTPGFLETESALKILTEALSKLLAQ